MKKLGLLLAVLFVLQSLHAKISRRPLWHRISQPVKIKVRHIDFYVFPNGDFDFNTHGSHYQHAGFLGVRIEKDHFGKIRRVGNVYIDYNRYGQVARIGPVFVKYNRRGLVVKIGHKQLRYHRRGYYIYPSIYRQKPGFVLNTYLYYGSSNYFPNRWTRYDNEVEDFEYDDDSNETYDDGNYYYKPKPVEQNIKPHSIKMRRR